MLVPFAEKGEETSLDAEKWAKKYINQVGDADVIIHGCSHYPYFEPYWKGCLPHATFINPGVTAANQLKETLMSLNIQSNNDRPSLSFYISGPEDIILQHIKTQFASEPYQLLSKIPVQ